MRLRQFNADRPAADDDQMIGAGPVFKYRLISEIGNPVEAGYRRNEGRGACRDDDAFGRDLGVARLDRPRADELAASADDGDAEAFKTLNAVMRRDVGDDGVNVIHHGWKVDLGRSEKHTSELQSQ